jgi:hypothetical protein
MVESDWATGRQLSLFFTCHEEQHEYSPVTHAIAILYNASMEEVVFTLPSGLSESWVLRFFSSEARPAEEHPGKWKLAARTMVLATMAIEIDDS